VFRVCRGVFIVCRGVFRVFVEVCRGVSGVFVDMLNTFVMRCECDVTSERRAITYLNNRKKAHLLLQLLQAASALASH
jgi:hypothetical protein